MQTASDNPQANTPNDARAQASFLMDLNGLSFAYDKHQPVLRDISASVKPGKVCALIGPNAAGKSTLLQLMMGQLAPTAGKTTVNGLATIDLPPRERAAMISYVPQRPAASLTFRVEQIVAMGRFALPENHDAIEQALDTFDLSAVRHRIYGELSVGQQQCVALARAWAQAFDAEPSRHAMLLDEPVSAMDLKHAHLTMGRLRELAERGFAVVAVLHDLNLTATYADDVWLLHEGRLVEAGSWQTVLQPNVLEPVYGVTISQTFTASGDRPMFQVSNPATMPLSTRPTPEIPARP